MFLGSNPFLFAQNIYTGPFQHKDNPYYWKNSLPHPAYWQQDVVYTIKAILDDSLETIHADQFELFYTNNSPDTLKELYFHLYENAFQPKSYYDQLWKGNKLKASFGPYEAQGKGTLLENVQVNGVKAEAEYDNTIVKVKLQKPLLPQTSLTFTCSFTTFFDTGSMRRRNKKFQTFGNKHFDGVHWYPIVCVYDAYMGWHTDQHLDKEFYADFGSFDVSLTLPSNYIVEATGVLQNKAEVLPDTLLQKLNLSLFKDKPLESAPSQILPPNSGRKTWHYFASNVHNFAFTADPSYRIGKVILPSGVEVISLVQEQHASKWQSSAPYAARIMEVYERDFGPYIWPKIIVADAQDGMEYPMLTLDGGLYPQHQGLLAHEMAHMWFYGMLGSNETYRAYLDEGFTQFATVWSMDQVVGEKRAKKGSNKYISKHLDSLQTRMESLYHPYIRQVYTGDDHALNTHSSDFESGIRHAGGYGLVYYKTGVMLYQLRYVLGEKLFLEAMKFYVKQWTGKHPYPDDFRKSIQAYTKVNLAWFFDQWLETTKEIDYSIDRVKKLKSNSKDSLTYQITLGRKSGMQMPIDLSVYTSTRKLDFHIPNQWFVKETKAKVLPKWYGWDLLQPSYSFQVTLPEKIREVKIDPSLQLADVDLTNNALISKNTKLYWEHWVLNTPVWSVQKDFVRPLLWWNGYDGLKVGLASYGNYFNQNHFFDLRLAYNTGWPQNQIAENIQKEYRPFSFYCSSKSNLRKWWKQLYYKDEIEYDAGLWRATAGFEKTFRLQDANNPRSTHIFLLGNFMYRDRATDLTYLLYPQWWSVGQRNSTLQMGIQRNYPWANQKGKGSWLLEARTPGLLSDLSYYYVQATLLHELNTKKLDFRTRLFGRGSSSFVPYESALYLAGGAPEDLYGNKLTKAQGFIPSSMLGFDQGKQEVQFQYAGGLNVRGFAGNYAPAEVNGQISPQSVGNSGASMNIEIDFERLILNKPVPKYAFAHFDTYAFYDMGMISVAQGNTQYLSPLFASGGLGTALTLHWVQYKWKPFTIRCDAPFFVNRVGQTQNYWDLRWVLGIQRSF